MYATPPFNEFIDWLEQSLAHLPGQDAQFDMAPEYRKHFDLASVSGKPCYEAAVMVLFYPDRENEDIPKLLLTVRPRSMSNHAGQVAFPGGRREKGEELMQTALRETEEEVSLPSSHIRIHGALTSLYIPPSNFCVHPFVGSVSQFPEMITTSDEVEEIFGVSIRELRNPGIRTFTKKEVRGEQVSVPCFEIRNQIIWGATAMMLAELVSVLDRL